MCVTIVGVIHDTTNSNVLTSKIPSLVAASTELDIKNYEFAGYSSWSEFTANCCCEVQSYQTNGTVNPTVSEVWKCLPNTYSKSYGGSFLYKVKNRVDSRGNGLTLRDYCSSSFVSNGNAGCGIPVYNATEKKFVVSFKKVYKSVDDAQVPDCSVSGVSSQYALAQLW